MVPSILEPRVSNGGRLGKNRTSELTVKIVGPEDLPAISFSSGKTRITTPAGRYAGHSVPLACATTLLTGRQKETAAQTESEFIFIFISWYAITEVQRLSYPATPSHL